jgi:glycerol kinase
VSRAAEGPHPGAHRSPSDPYFSATKLEWLLRDRSPDGLAFGTVDSWLVWKLTGGRVHATDVTNASRTMLLRLDTLDWDDELLELFGVERSLLPEIRRSSEVFRPESNAGARWHPRLQSAGVGSRKPLVMGLFQLLRQPA